MPKQETFNLSEKRIETERLETQQEKNPEKIEAEEIARKKLETLLDESFRNFAIRFANLGEYKEGIARGSLGKLGREAYIERKDSFTQYLKQAGRDWSETAWSQTDWEHSTLDMNVAHNLLKNLRRAHEDVISKRKENHEMIRVNTLKRFAKELQKTIKEEPFIRLRVERYIDLQKKIEKTKQTLGGERTQEIINVFNDAASSLQEKNEYIKHLSIKRKQKLMLKEICEGLAFIHEHNLEVDKLQIIAQFLNNTNWLNENEKNLRNVMNAIFYIEKRTDPMMRQYHLDLIYDLSAMDYREHHAFSIPQWGYLSRGKAEHILGAIATMSNKELLQEIAELSSKSGEMAHPIFDSHGVVRWPKTQEPEVEGEVFDLDQKKFIPRNE